MIRKILPLKKRGKIDIKQVVMIETLGFHQKILCRI